MKSKRVIASILAISAMTLIVTACGQSSSPANTGSSSSATSQSLNIDLYGTPNTLDPQASSTTLSSEVVDQMYDTLLTYKPQSTELTGDIAKSLSVSQDGLTYTFHLRKGVKFWNGTPCTAKNFVDAFERVLTKSVNSWVEGFVNPAIEGSAAFYDGKAKTISGITTPDKYTLQIKLVKPMPYFKYVLAMPNFSAIDMQYIDKIGGKKFAYKPMGTGPYILKSYKQGQSLTLVKNKNYFQSGVPKLDKINITIDKNVQNAVLRFKQGKTGFIANNYQSGLDSADFVSMIQSPKWKNDFLKMPQNALELINLNNKVGPFKSKLVRQAVNMAIDKSRLVKLMNGRVEAANQYLPPNIPGYEKNLPPQYVYSYNPKKAKELLKQAGYPNGFKTTLINPPGTPQNLLDSIQTNLKAIGIDMGIKNVTLSAYSQIVESGKEDMAFEYWSQDFPDPFDFLNSFLNSGNGTSINASRYSNPTVDKYLNQANVMKNGPERLTLYDKAQNQALSDAALLPLLYPVEYAVVQPWVKGFHLHPVEMDPLQRISIMSH